MVSQDSIALKLIDIFEILSLEPRLNFLVDNKVEIITSDYKHLLKIDSQKITLPISTSLEFLFKHKSPIQDRFVKLNILKDFIQNLSQKNSFLRLNHIGFCYKVESKNKERLRIKKETAKTLWHLYGMELSDEAIWLFIGNSRASQDPMVELLPVETSRDPEVDYWLPHIHIDIDTNLTVEELENTANTFFKGEIKPFRLDTGVYCVRFRLGNINGITLTLDLATKKRSAQNTRKYLLKKIV